MNFTGFDPTVVALLAELPHWDADRYAARKAEFAAGLTKPGLALVQDLADRARCRPDRGQPELGFAPASRPTVRERGHRATRITYC